PPLERTSALGVDEDEPDDGTPAPPFVDALAAPAGRRTKKARANARPRRRRAMSTRTTAAARTCPRERVFAEGPRERSGALDPPHQLDRAVLVQRLVQVAALRRLHARRAAGAAGALRDEAHGVVDQPLERFEPGARDAD